MAIVVAWGCAACCGPEGDEPVEEATALHATLLDGGTTRQYSPQSPRNNATSSDFASPQVIFDDDSEVQGDYPRPRPLSGHFHRTEADSPRSPVQSAGSPLSLSGSPSQSWQNATIVKFSRPEPATSTSLEYFTVTLHRTTLEDKVSVDVDFGDGKTLKVRKVKLGLLSVWNATFPDLAVEPGDAFVEINGSRGDSKALLQELVSAPALTILVKKGNLRRSRVVKSLGNSLVIRTQSFGPEVERQLGIRPAPIGRQDSFASEHHPLPVREDEDIAVFIPSTLPLPCRSLLWPFEAGFSDTSLSVRSDDTWSRIADVAFKESRIFSITPLVARRPIAAPHQPADFPVAVLRRLSATLASRMWPQAQASSLQLVARPGAERNASALALLPTAPAQAPSRNGGGGGDVAHLPRDSEPASSEAEASLCAEADDASGDVLSEAIGRQPERPKQLLTSPQRRTRQQLQWSLEEPPNLLSSSQLKEARVGIVEPWEVNFTEAKRVGQPLRLPETKAPLRASPRREPLRWSLPAEDVDGPVLSECQRPPQPAQQLQASVEMEAETQLWLGRMAEPFEMVTFAEAGDLQADWPYYEEPSCVFAAEGCAERPRTQQGIPTSASFYGSFHCRLQGPVADSASCAVPSLQELARRVFTPFLAPTPTAGPTTRPTPKPAEEIALALDAVQAAQTSPGVHDEYDACALLQPEPEPEASDRLGVTDSGDNEITQHRCEGREHWTIASF